MAGAEVVQQDCRVWGHSHACAGPSLRGVSAWGGPVGHSTVMVAGCSLASVDQGNSGCVVATSQHLPRNILPELQLLGWAGQREALEHCAAPSSSCSQGRRSHLCSVSGSC